jgi:hypothetical protein
MAAMSLVPILLATSVPEGDFESKYGRQMAFFRGFCQFCFPSFFGDSDTRSSRLPRLLPLYSQGGFAIPRRFVRMTAC